jgi:hypothetical protein
MSTSCKDELVKIYQKLKEPSPTYSASICGGVDHLPQWRAVVTLPDGRQFRGQVETTKIQAQNSAASVALRSLGSHQPKPRVPNILTSPPLKDSGSFINEISRSPLFPPEEILEERSVTTSSLDPMDLGLKFKLPDLPDCPTINPDSPAISIIKDLGFTSSPSFRRKELTRRVLLVDVENLPSLIDEIAEHYNLKILNLDIYAFLGEHHHLAKKKFPPEVIRKICPCTRKNGTDTYIQMFVGTLLSSDQYDEYLVASHDHFVFNIVDLITSDQLGWKKKLARVVTRLDHL